MERPPVRLKSVLQILKSRSEVGHLRKSNDPRSIVSSHITGGRLSFRFLRPLSAKYGKSPGRLIYPYWRYCLMKPSTSSQRYFCLGPGAPHGVNAALFTPPALNLSGLRKHKKHVHPRET
jgi:hypothetical protein